MYCAWTYAQYIPSAQLGVTEPPLLKYQGQLLELKSFLGMGATAMVGISS